MAKATVPRAQHGESQDAMEQDEAEQDEAEHEAVAFDVDLGIVRHDDEGDVHSGGTDGVRAPTTAAAPPRDWLAAVPPSKRLVDQHPPPSHGQAVVAPARLPFKKPRTSCTA